MRATVVRAVALLSLISFACAEKPQPQASNQPAALTAQQAKPTAQNVSAAKPAVALNAAPAAPSYPKGARYTIYCATMTGVDHVGQSTQFKNQLNTATPYKNFYVVHEDNQSILYYGFYKTFEERDDAKEAARAHKDMNDIRGLQDKSLNRPFEHAQPVPLNAPDPAAPPEWNLANSKGFWTIQIAAYKDSPDRKQAAVEAVKEARQQGIEAYFYHGETVSSVCVGAWPKEAIKAQDSDAASAGNPNESVMVSSVPIPEQYTKDMRDENGNRIRYMEAKLEIVDPSMQAVKVKFPYHAVNGMLTPRKAKDKNGKDTIAYDPSIVVMVPKAAPSELNRNIASGAPRVKPPVSDQSTIGSKLKSVGE